MIITLLTQALKEEHMDKVKHKAASTEQQLNSIFTFKHKQTSPFQQQKAPKMSNMAIQQKTQKSKLKKKNWIWQCLMAELVVNERQLTNQKGIDAITAKKVQKEKKRNKQFRNINHDHHHIQFFDSENLELELQLRKRAKKAKKYRTNPVTINLLRAIGTPAGGVTMVAADAPIGLPFLPISPASNQQVITPARALSSYKTKVDVKTEQSIDVETVPLLLNESDNELNINGLYDE